MSVANRNAHVAGIGWLVRQKNMGGWPKKTGGTLAPKIYMEGGILS